MSKSISKIKPNIPTPQSSIKNHQNSFSTLSSQSSLLSLKNIPNKEVLLSKDVSFSVLPTIYSSRTKNSNQIEKP